MPTTEKLRQEIADTKTDASPYYKRNYRREHCTVGKDSGRNEVLCFHEKFFP